MHPGSQLHHAFLQPLEVEFKRRWAGDPDEVGAFRRLRQTTPINFPHPAAELIALHRAAEPLRRQKSHRSRIGLGRIMREKIKRHPAVADAPALQARGIKNRTATNDPGTGKPLGRNWGSL